MNKTLQETIKLVPEQPGCYLYYDNTGEIIYSAKKKTKKERGGVAILKKVINLIHIFISV